MKWKKSKIGNHCEITSSKRIFYSEYVDSGVPFYRSKEIIEIVQGQQISEPLYISEHKYNEIKKRFGVPVAGDMLLTSVGTIGVPYVIKPDDRFYFKDGNLTWFRNFDDYLLSKFLCYWIGSKEGYSVLNNTTIGSSQKALTITSLNQIECPMPKTDIQLKIVEILSVYDDLIENNQKQIKLLEEAAQRLYKEWFVDLRFPGHEQTKIVDGVPDGWNRVLIGELECRIESGSRPKGGIDNSITKGVASIGAENVIGLGKYDYTSEKLISYEFFNNMKKGKIVDKDILIYKDGAYIGRTSLFQDAFPHAEAAVNEHVFLLHAKDEILQYYLFFTLYQTEYYAKMQKLNKNSAQPGINVGALLSLDLIIPKRELVLEFNRIVAGMVRQIFIKAKQCQRLKEARDLLLPKLINGEIEL